MVFFVVSGEGPGPEEIFSVIKTGDTKIVLKSGFDKYLSVDSRGRVAGRSDAIGSREQFEPIFQDVGPDQSLGYWKYFVLLQGKIALLGCNNCFISVNEDGKLVCSSQKAEEPNFVTVSYCILK
jgi:protein FRG1